MSGLRLLAARWRLGSRGFKSLASKRPEPLPAARALLLQTENVDKAYPRMLPDARAVPLKLFRERYAGLDHGAKELQTEVTVRGAWTSTACKFVLLVVNRSFLHLHRLFRTRKTCVMET